MNSEWNGADLSTTRNGLCCYGPKCARLMGLIDTKPKTKTTRWQIRCVEVQDEQQALEGFA